jgi:hypothetical protein
MTLAPLLAPQSKMAKARKTRAANATLRDFNEPNWLGGAISLACFKLSFTYKNLLDALTSTSCIVFVKLSSRQVCTSKTAFHEIHPLRSVTEVDEGESLMVED